ncbi:MAG: AAA domain-containing protein [Planctomycetaceae bacterium]|nr:AAA domain-containing protein [Planctomycetaceae bacterium]
MAQVNLKQLIGKLNATTKRSLEAASGACLSRSHYNIEIEHWILKLLEQTGNDLHFITRQFDVDPLRLKADLDRSLDKFKTGNSRPPAISPDLIKLVKEAWLTGSIEFGGTSIRSGFLICALLSDDILSTLAHNTSPELSKISPEQLRENFYKIVNDSCETSEAALTSSGQSPAQVSSGGTGGKASATPALDQYTIDLTDRARAGEIDPVLGRDLEIRQITDILTRRRQNNPILTGEAGVGKTAVVEGFALKLAEGMVPPALKNVALKSLDLGLLQAGAGVKGEFENRLKTVIQEIKSSPTPIILFIDEAHTMIGAGGQAGQGDAANLLKPALARGELRTIAATTWSEYKQYFEKDPALTRRFQVIRVEEPTEEIAVQMMRGITGTLSKHHQVRVLNEAILDSVRLSSRYISGRQLPDKSVSLLDTTCARIGLSQAGTPAPVEDCNRNIEQLKVAIRILKQEMQTGIEHADELKELNVQLQAAEDQLEQLNKRWQQEKVLVTQINELHASVHSELDQIHNNEAEIQKRKNALQLLNQDESSSNQEEISKLEKEIEDLHEHNSAAADAPEMSEKVSELNALKTELETLQGETPLVHAEVNSQAIAETVSAWTGIPLGRMVADELNTVLNLESVMGESIIGQDHALSLIGKTIRTSRANLNDPRTPIGIFLLVGTSGVGKTETAITLAEQIYGGEQNMTVINMSEFKGEEKASTLYGASPGLVGYGKGGVLTEAVRRKPFSVILLDEMEKAHKSFQDIFYQVFDKGNMKDGEGRDIDFKNTVIMMTSNAGSDLIKNLCSDPEMVPSPDAFVEAIFPKLMESFAPAFLGRTKIVPFYPLNDEVMQRIIKLKLNKVGKRVRANYRAQFEYTPKVVEAIKSRCTEVDTGARNIDHILNKTLLPELSSEFLASISEGKAISSVKIDVAEDEKLIYEIS